MLRAAMLEILSQRSADLLRQWQYPLAPALSGAQAELSCVPIQIVEFGVTTSPARRPRPASSERIGFFYSKVRKATRALLAA